MPVSSEVVAVASKKKNQPLVLVIEDNPDVVQYLIACLDSDYQIEVAHNGQRGIDKALEIIPDLIISDVMMPEKDGFEVTQFLKTNECTSHIPIILLTAKADVASKIEGLQRGADAYLPKPFDKMELLVRMEKLLELRKNLRSYYLSLIDSNTVVKPTEDSSTRGKSRRCFCTKTTRNCRKSFDRLRLFREANV